MRRAQLLARRGELMVFLWASGKEVNLEPQAHYSPAKAMQASATSMSRRSGSGMESETSAPKGPFSRFTTHRRPLLGPAT